jgi:hydrogenase maturation protease
MTALVIGYGNRLRCDDGAGPRLAEWVAARRQPDVVVVACHQLMPELIQPLRTASRVLFIDAARGAPALRLLALPSQPPQAVGAGAFSHVVSPLQLLALAEQLEAATPAAWQLLIPAHRCELGERLSRETAAACRSALPLLRRWLTGDA